MVAPPARGTVFKIAPSGTLRTIYRFCAKAVYRDGEYASQGLVQATDGNFYGTTDATSVSFDGDPAVLEVVSSTEITAAVPAGASGGRVQVVTPSGALFSNVPYRVLP